MDPSLASPLRPWREATMATLVRRYKRFLADVTMPDGSELTVHCPNSGSMMGMAEPGSKVLVSHNPDPRRKLAWTWELVHPPGEVWVGCNTMRPNRIVEHLVTAEMLPIDACGGLRREVPLGASRLDIMTTDSRGRACFVEVKNTTLAQGTVAMFPDAVTRRGARHMHELAAAADAGHRAVVAFFVNRGDCTTFTVADQIDPAYGRALRDAVDRGVEVMPIGMDVGPDGWTMRGVLPWDITPS